MLVMLCIATSSWVPLSYTLHIHWYLITIVWRGFFQPCGHAATFQPKMVAVAQFLLRNSHFPDFSSSSKENKHIHSFIHSFIHSLTHWFFLIFSSFSSVSSLFFWLSEFYCFGFTDSIRLFFTLFFTFYSFYEWARNIDNGRNIRTRVLCETVLVQNLVF